MESITITVDKTCENLTISGCKTKKEALSVAEEWCDENNCLLVSKDLGKSNDGLEDSSIIYFAKVSTDDYD